MEAFEQAVIPIIGDDWIIEDFSGNYTELLHTMEDLSGIINLVLIGATGAVIVIVGLLITLFLYDRKHEIGTYLALGESKNKITAQIILEVLLLSTLGIIIALFVGNYLAVQISNWFLTTELTEMLNQPAFTNAIGPGWMFGIPPQTRSVEEMMALFNVTFGLREVMRFLFIMLLATLFPTFAATALSVKKDPKKILM